MKTFTGIARCSTCGKELNRAEGVPDVKRVMVEMTAPLMAICDVREHNTFSDLNLRVQVEWIEEGAAA